MLQQFASHTPIWVWLLLAFLIMRGVKAMRPGETTLGQLAIVPAIFIAWSLWSISARFPGALAAWALWLGGIAAGTGLGWWLMRRATMHTDRATGALWRSADYSLLPLLVLTFVLKYGFESAFAMSPSLALDTTFRTAYLLLSGALTGIFVGRLLRYVAASRRAAGTASVPAA